MYDVITIGAALVDIYVHSDHFQTVERDGQIQLCQTFGDKVEMDSLSVFSGGGAGNTAVAFQRLGFAVGIVAELGRDAFAEIVVKELETEGVNTSLLIKERKEQTGGSVVLIGQSGERVVLVHRGAAAQLTAADLPAKDLVKAHWLHLTNVAGQRTVVEKVFRLAKEHHLKVSWTPGKAELELLKAFPLSELGVQCDVLILNQEEWESVQLIHDQLHTLIEHIVVTNGEHGGTLFLKGRQPYGFAAKHVKVADATGAGDSFAAGYVAALLLEKTPLTAVEWGLLNATANIQVVGAKTGLLTRAELETMT